MKSKILFYLILLTFFASLIPAVHAQTFSVIHTFTGGAGGGWPSAGVTIRGNALYGTTFGDYGNCGTVYQLTHSGSKWLFSTLAALPHNCSPAARVVFGPDGHLYGTSGGGTFGQGTVFKLTPPVGICSTVACYWTITDLHDFAYTDGADPKGGDLIWDQQGNIYGTTDGGGTYGGGTVYELTPSGNGYTESVLCNFPCPDGAFPWAGLVLDNKGNLFGTTGQGGYGVGTIFELSYVVGVGWTEQVLYSFQDASDGRYPVAGLIFDSSGNLYGTTNLGGSGGAGTVFELSPSGDAWTFKLLYSFSGPENWACGPSATLTMDGTGNLYGTTACGNYTSGSVFKLSNTENGWVYTSLHDFTGGTDGRSPSSNVTFDTEGNLYGTTGQGGTYGRGVVWMITP